MAGRDDGAREERLAWLRSLDLFASLPQLDLEPLADALVRLAFRPGALIARAVDSSPYLYLVLAGQVELDDGRVAGPGEHFGGEAQPATGVARTDVTLYALDGASAASAVRTISAPTSCSFDS